MPNIQSKSTSRRGRFAGGLVLVVEDEELFRSIIVKLLSDAGYGVLEAADGSRAIETFAEHGGEIRLVLLDFALPGKDGLSVLTEIRNVRPDVDAIVCSSYLPPGIADRFLQLGVRRFIEKPFLSEELLGAVREVLGS